MGLWKNITFDTAPQNSRLRRLARQKSATFVVAPSTPVEIVDGDSSPVLLGESGGYVRSGVDEEKYGKGGGYVRSTLWVRVGRDWNPG